MAAAADPRFARLHNDPRFRRAPKRERKVKVDRRFASMFTDERFSTGSTADKYGRRSGAPKASGQGLDRLFELEDEGEGADGEGHDGPPRVSAPSASRVASATAKKAAAARSSEAGKAKAKALVAAGRAKAAKAVPAPDRAGEPDSAPESAEEGSASGDLGAEGAADGESDWTEEASSEEDEMVDEMDGQGSGGATALVEWIDQGESVPRVRDGTRRLAAVNLNWDQVRAVDLLAVLRSFEPSGGSVLGVSVFLSDFGEAQQAIEATRGPVGAWEQPSATDNTAGEGRADHAKRRAAAGEKKTGAAGKQIDAADPGLQQNGAADTEALRRYELSRFRYYYAVVTCDSVGTAEHIYAECDGAEFENSAMVLDLRFIPDEMEFTRQPRDSATELPPKYAAPAFSCSALQQSNVKLSWDADDAERAKVTKRDFTKVELREQDYSALLASSSDSGGEEEWAFEQAPPPPRRGRENGLAALLRSGNDTEGVPDAELGREATFDAFDSKRKRSRAEGEESVWRVQQRQMADKRRERRKVKEAEEADGSDAGAGSDEGGGALQDPFFADSLGGEAAFSDDDLGDAGGEEQAPAEAGRRQGGEARRKGDKPEVERKKKKPKRKGRRGEEEEAEEGTERAADRARLELLLLGDGDAAGGAVRGYDVRRLEMPKKKRKQAAPAQDDSGFALDMNDPRFGRLFVSHDYAVDPHDPRFVRTQASEALLAEVAKRHDAMREAGGDAAAAGTGAAGGGVGAPDGSLSALVSAVKRKAAAAGAVGHGARAPPAATDQDGLRVKARKKGKRTSASNRA